MLNTELSLKWCILKNNVIYLRFDMIKKERDLLNFIGTVMGEDKVGKQ